MAKKVISISCPQCKATDAQLLSDGTYQCKYCGTRFIIDDDTVTQNININVNVKHEQQYSNVSQPTVQHRMPNTEYEKRVKRGIGCMCFIFVVIIWSCIKTCYDNSHTDVKQLATLSENLTGEHVVLSQPVLHNGKTAFFAVTERNSGNAKGLKLIYASDFKPIKIDVPVNFTTEEFPWRFIRPTNERFTLTTNKYLYHFDFDSLRFVNITDSVLAKNEKLKAAGVAKMSWQLIDNDILTILITSADGRSYYYSPATDKVYDEQSAKDIPVVKAEIDTAFYVITGDKPVIEKRLFHITITEKSVDYKLVKTLSKTPLDMESADLVFQNGRSFLLKYNLNGLTFLRKTDTLGNEIYTRRSDDFTVDNYGILPAKGVGVSDKSLTVIPCIQNKKYRYLYVYGDADSTKIVMESIKDK